MAVISTQIELGLDLVAIIDSTVRTDAVLAGIAGVLRESCFVLLEVDTREFIPPIIELNRIIPTTSCNRLVFSVRNTLFGPLSGIMELISLDFGKLICLCILRTVLLPDFFFFIPDVFSGYFHRQFSLVVLRIWSLFGS